MSTTLVVAGVSGTGKSTVAAEVAAALDWPFREGDALHPAHNVAKMAAGLPLTDADRAPWLHALAGWVGEQEVLGRDVVLTCSALKRSYREVLRAGHPSVVFVQLVAPADVLAGRMTSRVGHFMPTSLLSSQLADLELLGHDEPGWVQPSDLPPDQLVHRVVRRLEAAGRVRAGEGSPAPL